jgi:hypothetical protein
MKSTKKILKKKYNKNSKTERKQNSVDYYCYSQFNVCGWTMVSYFPYTLLIFVIL